MVAIRDKAIEYGLDFYEVIFEVLDFETMNQIASYGGFPIRYPHWRWGMEFEQMSRRDAYGLGRIYEMVINNDPCYAYLQESNATTDQKLVMAHVYGHADFFKNNLWFAKTDRKMMNTMANHATRVQRHIDKRGQEPVESFIDCCLSIEHLIDPYAVFSPARSAALWGGSTNGDASNGAFEPDRLPAKPYMDRYINPEEELAAQRAAYQEKVKAAEGRTPAEPTRDVLLYLMLNAPLADWQADVLQIIRDEAYYYAPQAMTKIMNEGWASYWHSKLMTGHFLEAKEIVDYADQHSGVVFMPAGGFNPYKIGIEMFREIEERWDKGQHGVEWERLESLGERERVDDKSMKGREKIFEVRKIYNDVNFVDEFLTEEFVEKHNMYRYVRDPHTGEVRVASRDWLQVKRELLARITNMGQPFIWAIDGNYKNRGELYLAHQWTGLEVDLAKASEVLKNIRIIWGRPVHLQAMLGDHLHILTIESDDGEMTRERTDADLLSAAGVGA
jgi:stage V sporulation protein R